MTIRRIVPGVLAAVLILAASGCEDGLTDLNENPNAPTDVPATLLIRPAITASATNGMGVGMTWNHAGLWAQHFAQIQYPDEDRFLVRDGTVQAFWDGWYAGPLRNLQTIIQKGEEENRPNDTAMGLILRAWNVGIISDLWGDVPFSQAVSGEGGQFTPTYDTQQEIYTALFADLRRAAEMIDPAQPGMGAVDLIYAGDMEKWRMFANSLRLRLAMRLSHVEPGTARTEFEAALAGPGGVFQAESDQAKLEYLAATNRNPFFENQLTRDDHRISATLVNHLIATGDPRLPVYADPIQSDGVSYIGHENGRITGSAPLTERSKVGTWFTSATSPVFFLRHAEVLFLRAEGAELGWNAGGSAEALYEAAVRASMAQYGISEAAASDFLAQPENNFAAAGNKLQLIGTQKWVALFGQGTEAYAEWRRTGYPSLTPGPEVVLPQIPRRFPYPALETSLNQASLNAALQRQGDVSLQGRVWWDRP
jgi:hypothetical protein